MQKKSQSYLLMNLSEIHQTARVGYLTRPFEEALYPSSVVTGGIL